VLGLYYKESKFEQEVKDGASYEMELRQGWLERVDCKGDTPTDESLWWNTWLSRFNPETQDGWCAFCFVSFSNCQNTQHFHHKSVKSGQQQKQRALNNQASCGLQLIEIANQFCPWQFLISDNFYLRESLILMKRRSKSALLIYLLCNSWVILV
jgi:hypothetical protein